MRAVISVYSKMKSMQVKIKKEKTKIGRCFGGSVDPDNMNIIKAIMGVLHRDEEDIRADTMISLHYAIGSPMYEGSNSEFHGPQNLYGKKIQDMSIYPCIIL